MKFWAKTSFISISSDLFCSANNTVPRENNITNRSLFHLSLFLFWSLEATPLPSGNLTLFTSYCQNPCLFSAKLAIQKTQHHRNNSKPFSQVWVGFSICDKGIRQDTVPVHPNDQVSQPIFLGPTLWWCIFCSNWVRRHSPDTALPLATLNENFPGPPGGVAVAWRLVP